jgi:hypothetical protein
MHVARHLACWLVGWLALGGYDWQLASRLRAENECLTDVT